MIMTCEGGLADNHDVLGLTVRSGTEFQTNREEMVSERMKMATKYANSACIPFFAPPAHSCGRRCTCTLRLHVLYFINLTFHPPCLQRFQPGLTMEQQTSKLDEVIREFEEQMEHDMEGVEVGSCFFHITLHATGTACFTLTHPYPRVGLHCQYGRKTATKRRSCRRKDPSIGKETKG
jgi:hypothetical protein